jgi:hypothetical protein
MMLPDNNAAPANKAIARSIAIDPKYSCQQCFAVDKAKV